MSILLTLLAFQGASQADAGPRRAQPVAPLASLFSDTDYPVDAMARNAEGRVQVRLVIDPSGRVVDCKIAQSSGDAGLDATTCAILSERARFYPARNGQGVAVVDTATTMIAWRLAESAPSGISPFTAYWGALILSANTDGEVSCRMEVNGTRQPDRICPPIADAILEIAEQVRLPASVVVVQTLTPEGAITTSPETPYGQLLSEAEAEIIVDAEGQITQCRMLSRTVHVAQSPEPPDICARPRAPRYPPGAANRRARVSTKLYLGNYVEG